MRVPPTKETMMKLPTLIVLPLLLAAPATAQTLRPTLDYASAAKIRDMCVDWATKNNKKMAIAVLDARGMEVTYAHLDGTSNGVGDIARWKANSAAKLGRPTAENAARNPPANMPNVAALGGGVPIFTNDGTLLGGVGTSGGSPEEDAACGSLGILASGLKNARPQ